MTVTAGLSHRRADQVAINVEASALQVKRSVVEATWSGTQSCIVGSQNCRWLIPFVYQKLRAPNSCAVSMIEAVTSAALARVTGKADLYMMQPDEAASKPMGLVIPAEALEMRRAVLFLRGKGRRSPSHPPLTHTRDGSADPGVFAPREVSILSDAFEEACAFCEKSGSVSPALRKRMAAVIVHHAKRGVLDSHRLALKAIIA